MDTGEAPPPQEDPKPMEPPEAGAGADEPEEVRAGVCGATA